MTGLVGLVLQGLFFRYALDGGGLRLCICYFNSLCFFRNIVLHHLLNSASLPSTLRELLLSPWDRVFLGLVACHPAASQPVSQCFPFFSVVLFFCACKVEFIIVAVSWLCYKHVVLFAVLVEGCDVADMWRNKAAIIILLETGSPKAHHFQ